MGTYTSYVVDVIGLPPEASAKVVHILEEEYRLFCHTIDPDASRPEWAAHGPDLVFENGGTDTGQAEDIALALHKIAETVIHPFVFEVVEEAAEDWPGSRYIYIPGSASGPPTPSATAPTSPRASCRSFSTAPRRTSARSSKRPPAAPGTRPSPSSATRRPAKTACTGCAVLVQPAHPRYEQSSPLL